MIVDIMKANLEEQVQENKNINGAGDLINENDAEIMGHSEVEGFQPVDSVDEIRKKIAKESSNILEKSLEIVFNHFSSGLKFIGPLFAFILVTFVGVVSHSFFIILLPYWQQKLGVAFGIFISCLCLFILFNILFNYFLAVLVKPGSLSDVKQSKKYKEKNPYIFDISNEVDFNYILENNSIKAQSKEEDNICLEVNPIKIENAEEKPLFKHCNTCNEIKPLRAHHCQVCGYCVFKMDHHCPWINNCVGQNNHRYFVLFLTHTLIGCIFIDILASPIFFTTNVKNLPLQFNFVCILCLTGCILLLFFNTWNWFLVLNGNTTIEFWSLKAGFANDKVISNFSLNNISENIFLVFGTKSLWKGIFIPSIKALPYSGLEWSRLTDPNYRVKDLEGGGKYYHDEITQSIENDLLKDLEI